MNRRIALSLVFVALLAGSALVILAQPEDPIAKFRNADGGITIPGGAFTRELQQLLFGPKPKLVTEETVWLAEQTGYPTASYKSFTFSRPNLNVFVPSERVVREPVSMDWISSIWTEMRSFLSLDWLIGSAAAVDRFAVFNDAQCTATTVSTDADCWSTTTGGDGNGAPAAGDRLLLDTGVSPFTATGDMDANLALTSGGLILCSAAGAPVAACGGNFTGTFRILTFSLTFTGALSFNDSGGTVSISTGTLDGGAATFTSAADLSITGAAAITFDSVDLNGGTYAKGTSTLTIDNGNLTMAGGDLTSTSGAVAITGVVNISSASSAIGFGSETWTITNATGNAWTNASTDTAVWEAGTGTVIFNGGAANTITFAGANMAENEFNNLTLNDTAAITYTMATRGLRYGGTLSITDTATAVTLDTAGLALTGGGLTMGTNGTLTLGASTVTANAAWNFSAGTYTENTSTLIIATTATVTSDSGAGRGTSTLYNLTVNTGVTVTFAASLGVSNAFTLNGTVAADAQALFLNSSAATAFSCTSGTYNGTTNVFVLNATLSTILSITTACTINKPIQIENGAAGAITYTVSGGPLTLGSTDIFLADIIGANGDVTLAMGANNLTSTSTTGTFNIGYSAGGTNGLLTFSSGTFDSDTDVSVATAGSSVSWGSSTGHILSNAWTNSTTAAAWDAGTGTVLFDSATGETMTFAGANLAEAEFNSLTFTSSAGTAQTFTMATRGLRWLTTLTVSDTSSTTALATAGLALGAAADAADIVVGNSGILTANASTVIVNGVTMTGGTSGTITVTTGAWTVSGNWNTSGVGSVYTQGTSLVTFDATATITLLSTDNTFDQLTISAGTSTLGSAVVVTNALNISAGATFNTSGVSSFAVTAGSFTATGAATLTLNASTMTMNGDYTMSTTGTLNEGTSTIVIAATSTVSIRNTDASNVYNLTVNSGVTASLGTQARWSNILTVNGTLAVGWLTVFRGSQATPLAVGASGVVSAPVFEFAPTAGASFNIPQTTYGTVNFTDSDAVGTTTYTLTGGPGTTTTFGTLTVGGDGTGTEDNVSILNTGTVSTNVTATTLTLGVTFGGAWVTGSGATTVTINGAVSIAVATSYIDLAAEVWTVTGSWTNSTTTASWDAGTGTVTFNGGAALTMTFAGANLAEDEFSSITFNSTAAMTYTMATRGLRWGGTMSITDTVTAVTLDTAGLALTGGGLTTGTNGTLTLGASAVTANAAWNFSAGTYNEGTSTLTIATSLTITPDSVGFPGANIANLTVNASITATVATNGLTLNTASTATINGTITGGGIVLQLNIDGAPATPLVVGASGSISGMGTVRYTGCNNATYSVNLPSPAAFPTLSVLAGNATAGCDLAGFGASQVATLTATANITIASAFVFYTDDGAAAGDFDLDLTATNYSLTVTGATSVGQATGNDAVINLRASTVTFTGAITLNVSAAFITTGAATVTASAAYTNNSTNAADWNVTAGTWTFDSATGGTMTFAGANMAENEFNSLTFTSSAGTAQTFTMATRGIRWLTTLTVSDTSSTTALATADLAVGAIADTPDISIGNGGILTANASTVIISTFTMTGGTSGTLTITTGAWTVSGNWNSSGAGSTFTQGTGIHTFDATATITLLSTDNTFDDLTISAGTSTLGSAVVVTNALLLTGGAFTTSGSNFAVTVGTLTASAGTFTANGSTITVSGTANFVGSTFVEGTSTLVLAATGNLTMDVTGSRTVNDLYNLTINVGTTTTLLDSIGIGQVLTLNGTITGAWTIFFSSTSADPLVLGGSHGFGTIATVLLASTVNYNVPASTGYPTLDIESDGATIATLTGNITATTIEIASVPSAITLAANSRTITLSQGIALTQSGSALTFTTGVLDTGASGTTIISLGTYVQWGSGSHMISGSWANSTTNASWDAGTGTVTFDSATGATLTFAGSNLAEAEFSSVTFNSTGVTAQTFTMATRGLSWSGTLTISGDTILAKATFTLGAEASGALTVGGAGSNGLTSTSGAVTVTTVSISGTGDYIDLGSEAWAVSGTWTNATTSASWDAGTGTVTFNSATGGTMTFAGANLAEDEFSGVTFNSTGATAQTFTMATRGLRWGGTLTITDATGGTTLAKATFTLAGGALTISGAAASGLTSTSGAVTVTTVSVSTATAFIDLGSEAWTVSGDWDNSSTSASWDAGTGTVTFTSTTAQSMTFATFTTWEAEFDSATFNSSAATAITFTGAGGPLGFATTLTITDSSSTTTLSLTSVSIRGDASSTIDMTNANGLLSFTTGDIVDVSDLNITGGQMTMDGVTGITDIRIQATAPDDFDITAWTLYSVTGGGVPDIRWTMDPDVGNTNVIVTAEGVTALNTFSIYRDGVDIQQAGSNGSGVVTFTGGSLNSGWSSHTMIIALPGLTFGGGGGGGGGGGPPPAPTVLWTWRHLSEDLTVEFVIQGSTALGQYEWVVDGKVIGKGDRIEYVFPLSGTYKVTLHAKILDFVVDTPQDIQAKSISFLGRYFPVLALALIGLWFIILVLAETYKSNAGRLYGMSIALAGFGLAIWMVTSTAYRTFSMSGINAFQVIGGIALFAAGGAVKNRLAALALGVVGLVLMVLVYVAIIL